MRLVRRHELIESPLRRAAVVACAAIVALLLCTASAEAAVRFAAPTGAGANPCNPTACSLKVAIEGAQDGDEVVVGAGVYAQPTPISVGKAISVGGAVGEAAPTIGLGGVQFEVHNAGASIHDLHLVLTKEGLARAFVLGAGSAERIVADPRGLGADGCSVENGTLRDSLCVEGLTVAAGEPGTFKATIANVTAGPILVGAFSGAHMDAYIVNSIAVPSLSPFSSKAGLSIDVSAGSSLDAVLRNSNYNEVDTTLSSGTQFAYTAPGTNGNQTAPPQFVDAAAGDFTQLPTSPTIDGGVEEALIGGTDVLGAPRIQARCIGGTPVPDIGAYEFQPVEPCPAPPAGSGSGGSGSPTTPPSQPPIGPPKVPRRIGKVKVVLDRARGTAMLKVNVPGAGKVSVTGKGIVAARVRAKKAEVVRLMVKPKGAAAKTLRETGKVKLKARVAERLADGSKIGKLVPVTLKLG